MNKQLVCLVAALVLAGPAPLLASEPVWDANKVTLQAQSLSPGVWAMVPAGADLLSPKGIPLATTSGIVVGTRATLVIDTMLNERLAKMVLDQARKAGGRTPTYAVNTSYHGDHSYGNMYLPATTVVIQHEATKSYIDSNFKADTEFMMGAFGKGRGIEKIRPRTGDVLVSPGGMLRVDLGGKTVEIRDFGFAQTGGDLWVWLPQDKVMFAGNPIVTEKPGIPWLLDGHVQATLDTLTRVRDFLPDGARVVPGHGRPLAKAGLDWHIAYLTALRDQTRAAIQRGATADEAVAQVALPEFQGYAIFDWIHKQVNVPAAYKEFKK